MADPRQIEVTEKDLPLHCPLPSQALWNKHAANTASLTFQQPFRVALHASRLIARSAS